MIRTMQRSDIGDMVKLLARYTDTMVMVDGLVYDEKETCRHLVQLVESDRSEREMFVADVDGKIVGFVMCIVFKAFLYGPGKMSDEVVWWTVPEHRGNGIGSALLKAYEDWAVGYGAVGIFCSSFLTDKDSTAVALLEARGYSVTESKFKKGVL